VSDLEKRRSGRIGLLGTVPGDVLVALATEIRQLSLGGMLIETRFPLQVESLHEFRLVLGGRTVIVKGRVAHSRIGDVLHDAVMYQTGVEFVAPSEGVTNAIREYLESLARERS
jgi:hypothetical protein